MIARLRARHRAMIAVLSVALPIGFVAALAGRDDETDAERLPEVLADSGSSYGALRRKLSAARDGRAFSVLVGERPDAIGVLQEDGEPAPSVMAYWTAVAADDELPPDARWLGPVGASERRYALHEPATSERGAIVFFSLGHGEVVGVVQLASEGR